MPSYALNFYSPIVEAQLRSHRKTATIRLGDKSRKYQKGMIVAVLVGARYGPRQHVFDAVIDKVEVKRLAELSPREIEHDNPEIRRPEEHGRFLGQLYNREVTEEDIVTVIRFSAIKARRASNRACGDGGTTGSSPACGGPCRSSTRSARATGRAAAPRTTIAKRDGTARRTSVSVERLAAYCGYVAGGSTSNASR